MKMLIVPMAAMAETAGSFSRAVILADALKKPAPGPPFALPPIRISAASRV